MVHYGFIDVVNDLKTQGVILILLDLDNQYLPGPQTALVLKDHRALLLRPQQVIIGGTLDQPPIMIDHPLKNMEDRGIFDSGCSGHMTGNKDHLDDFEECKGGSVTFGGSKGYITDLEEEISPTTLEASKILSKVASQRSKSVDKGKRYKRRKESKGKDIDSGFEDISTGFEEVNTSFEKVNTGGLGVSTDRGQREGKAPMIIEETQAPKRTKEQI
ncbi:hypothetical protein Tco_0102522, partial [Tanacetum coccineum]